MPIRGQPALDIVFARTRSRDVACDLHVLLSLATAVLDPEGWQLRSTRSNASICGACRLFKANEPSRDELGHRLTHENQSLARGRTKAPEVEKLCKEVVTPCRPSDQEDLYDDDSDLHIVATCA